MDKRKAWRQQEQQLIERWNAATERHRDIHAEIACLQPSAGSLGPSKELLLKAEAVRAELEALRRQVARLKVEFNSGKRY